jgi:hypothetical protein
MILLALRLTKRHPSATLKCNALFFQLCFWDKAIRLIMVIH